jgi:two-component system, sensor histidine kinase and response regulator
VGIQPEVKARLFQPFSQADNSTTRKFGGTGLGLAIAKQLSEMMGGEVGLGDREGGGTIFWFTVRCPIAPNVVEVPDASLAVLRGARILVVEDNPTNRAILAEQLTLAGADAALAANGLDGLAALRNAAAQRAPFNSALLDMKMPGMNGLDLAQAIKADGTLAPLPVVMLTSANMTGAVAAAR